MSSLRVRQVCHQKADTAHKGSGALGPAVAVPVDIIYIEREQPNSTVHDHGADESQTHLNQNVNKFSTVHCNCALM